MVACARNLVCEAQVRKQWPERGGGEGGGHAAVVRSLPLLFRIDGQNVYHCRTVACLLPLCQSAPKHTCVALYYTPNTYSSTGTPTFVCIFGRARFCVARHSHVTFRRWSSTTVVRCAGLPDVSARRDLKFSEPLTSHGRHRCKLALADFS